MIDDFNQFLAIGPVKRTVQVALQMLEHVSMTAPSRFSFACLHQALNVVVSDFLNVVLASVSD